MTGDGMYRTRAPKRKSPNTTWKAPATNTTKKRVASVFGTSAGSTTAGPSRVRLCSAMAATRKARTLRGEYIVMPAAPAASAPRGRRMALYSPARMPYGTYAGPSGDRARVPSPAATGSVSTALVTPPAISPLRVARVTPSTLGARRAARQAAASGRGGGADLELDAPLPGRLHRHGALARAEAVRIDPAAGGELAAQQRHAVAGERGDGAVGRGLRLRQLEGDGIGRRGGGPAGRALREQARRRRGRGHARLLREGVDAGLDAGAREHRHVFRRHDGLQREGHAGGVLQERRQPLGMGGDVAAHLRRARLEGHRPDLYGVDARVGRVEDLPDPAHGQGEHVDHGLPDAFPHGVAEVELARAHAAPDGHRHPDLSVRVLEQGHERVQRQADALAHGAVAARRRDLGLADHDLVLRVEGVVGDAVVEREAEHAAAGDPAEVLA